MKPARILFSIFFLSLYHLGFTQDANLVMPLGHAQQVNQIAMSHDFSLMASIDDTHVIHIWDVATKRELYQLKKHEAGIVNVSWHPSRKEMISSDAKGNILVWNMTNASVIREIKVNDERPFIYYSENDQIFSAGKGRITQFDSNGQEITSIEINSPTTAIEFSKSNKKIVTGDTNGLIQIIDPVELKVTGQFQDEKTKINVIATHAERSQGFVGYDNGIINKVNLLDGTLMKKMKVFSESVGGIIVDPADGGIMTTGYDEKEDVKVLERDMDNALKFKWDKESERRNKDDIRGIAWANAEKTEVFVADHGNVIRHYDFKNNDWIPGWFKGTARPVYDIDVDPIDNKLFIGAQHSQIKIFDMTGANFPAMLSGHENGIIQLDLHFNGHLLVAVGRDDEIKIWNPRLMSLRETIKKPEYPNFNMAFTVDRNFIRKTGPSTFESMNFKTRESQKIELDGANDMKISPDGEQIYFRRDTDLSLYSSITLQPQGKILVSESLDFSFVDEGILVLQPTKVSMFKDKVKTNDFSVQKYADKITGLADGGYVLYSSETAKNYDYSAYHYDNKGKLLGQMSAHSDYITKIIEHNDRLLSSSLDGSIRIWKKKDGTYEEIGTLITLWRENFVVTTPDKLFDASSDAMSEAHFTRGSEIIALEQLKDVYYEPNLFPKLMGYGNGEIRKPLDLARVGSAPKVQITGHPNVTGGKLSLKITEANGGVGRVTLDINGKEVTRDMRLARAVGDVVELDYDIKGHPYLFDNKPNKITIKAYNKDETLSSEPKSIFVLPSGNNQAAIDPKIYSVIIGTSDYADNEMDLKYAAKDAEDFASALKISSSNLIGGANLNMTVLTTNNSDKSKWPTKENIKKAFTEYAQKANARDYLIVYMAGHGVNSGGQDGDFYYLTCTATDGRVYEQATKEKHAISSSEFTEYIKSVPALNQVMIVDACHSGTLTSAFGREEPSKTMSSEEVKAYERMKDRTGIFLLAGSAADAVSYETTLYGQGLLTYALLFGMKGAALHDGEYIDVLDLFQFAAKKVPQLAEDIGGIQRPEVRVPTEARSFNIGKMTDEDKRNIKLVSPKPVFVHTNFQSEKNFQDDLRLGKAIDLNLKKLSKDEKAPIIFMNENQFSGAYVVRGRYFDKGAKTIVQVKVFQEEELKMEFEVDGVNTKSLSDRITERLQELAQKS